MIWLAIIVPILFAIIGLVYFRKRLAFWEYFIPLAVTLIIIAIFKYVGVESLIKDKEYWGNYVTEVRYYQEWDEWIEQTCTRSYPCGTDSKGNTEYCTETYDCSYRSYHPEHWSMLLNDGDELSISKDYYNNLRNRFGAKDIFVDMGRDFYHIDGDMFKTLYPNTYDAFEFYSSAHSYENKIQASTSIFNYPVVTPKDIADFKLYDYPATSSHMNAILAPSIIRILPEEQRKFDYINGMLGMSKHIRIWVCLFETTNDKAGFMQEALWKRGNKNEFVICVGIDRARNISWVHVFGWSKNKLIDVETRDYVIGQKKLNLLNLGDFMYKEANTNWKMANFEEFNKLTIEPPSWAIKTTWIISILSCIGLYFWLITNQFTSTDINGDGYDEIDETEKISDVEFGFKQRMLIFIEKLKNYVYQIKNRNRF